MDDVRPGVYGDREPLTTPRPSSVLTHEDLTFSDPRCCRLPTDNSPVSGADFR